MRTLTNEEITTVAGGRGINIGDIGSGNETGNGNSVDAGHNAVSADGNASGNHANVSANNATHLTSEVSNSVTSVLQDLVGGIL